MDFCSRVTNGNVLLNVPRDWDVLLFACEVESIDVTMRNIIECLDKGNVFEALKRVHVC